ncbi:MAG: TolC family protein [Campylobacterota bacterium]|nr:TolC family protein [Campylobacterota bacterium]
MFHKLFFLLIPALMYADSLQELLNHANSNNNLILSKNLSQQAIQSELDATHSSQAPTVDMGTYYQRLDERSFMMAGDVYSAYAKFSYDIYDGGRKHSTIKQKQSELHSSRFDAIAFKNSLSLQIVQDFFAIKNIEASINSFNEEKRSLNAQLIRIKKFYEAQLSTKDAVDKLQSAYDTNNYMLQSLKFQKQTVLKSLELKVGKTITSLDDARFKSSNNIKFELNNTVHALQAQEKSLQHLATSMQSAYKPQLNITDTFNVNGYDRTDATHPKGLDNQNKLMLSLNIRLYDGAAVSKNKQAVLINKRALKNQIIHKTKEQEMLFDLSVQRIQTNKLKIQSASSALRWARSTFVTIEEKYKAGIVDNVSYLDALSVQTNARTMHQQSLYDLEIAYAMYYFYAGKNIGEYIQ